MTESSATATTTAPCVACGGGAFSSRPYPAAGAADAGLRFEDIRLCAACGLGQALPARPQSALDAFYASGSYWASVVAPGRAQNLHAWNQCRHRVAAVLVALTARAPLRVLDVGAGQGWTADWLVKLAPQGVERFDFVEPDDGCSAAIEARKPCTAVRRLDSLAQARPGYDVVFLNHVLEHVADPVACAHSVTALLADGGLAYVEVPHADYRFKDDVFPHTWFFTPAALHHLAERAGVNEQRSETFGRLPAGGPLDLACRAGFRGSAALGAATPASWFDDRLWRYQAVADGIWLRWIVARPASRPG